MISIILPFYHVKREYMEECMKSIREQTYENWEIIIVDDGSEEGDAQWLDTYIAPQVRVVHQKNAGVSAARNRGIQEASGEWIYFCDPDDIMMPNELDELYSIAKESKSDIAVCGYVTTDYDDRSMRINSELGTKQIDYISDMRNLQWELIAPGIMTQNYKLSFHNYSLCFPWGHLYKKECIKEIEFPLGLHPGEDRVFNIIACGNAKRMVMTNEKLHVYRIGYGVTGRYNANSLNNSRKTKELIRKLVSDDINSILYKNAMAKYEADEMAYLMKWHFFHKDNPLKRNERIKQFHKYIKSDMQYYPKYVDLKTLTRKQKILLLVYKTRMIYFIELFINFAWSRV